jgi:hypothetical protein
MSNFGNGTLASPGQRGGAQLPACVHKCLRRRAAMGVVLSSKVSSMSMSSRLGKPLGVRPRATAVRTPARHRTDDAVRARASPAIEWNQAINATPGAAPSLATSASASISTHESTLNPVPARGDKRERIRRPPGLPTQPCSRALEKVHPDARKNSAVRRPS